MIKELPSFLQLPKSKETSIPQWEHQCRVKSPLHIVNLYRKVFMGQLGVYKLNIVQFECSDPFIVREFLETRIAQIQISQDNEGDEFVIDIKNNISQEMCITTDHIRWFNNKTELSARKSRGLCGYAHLAKLDTGKHIFVKMKKVINTPVYHDTFRAGTFIATEVPDAKRDDSKLVFSHQREESICKIFMFGSLSPAMFKENLYCTRAFQQIIDAHMQSLQVLSRGYELIISLCNFPEYITDPVMCELMSDFRANFKQIIPKGNTITLVSDTPITEEDVLNYTNTTKQTLQILKNKLQELEMLIVQSM